MTYTEIKDAVIDGQRISGKPHEELLWYQLREIQTARKNLVDPAKIQQRERETRERFYRNCRHEEIAAAAIEKINALRIIVFSKATEFSKKRDYETAVNLIRCFDNLPSFGKEAEGNAKSTAASEPDK